jgi:para-nitrobenzyl esterase
LAAGGQVGDPTAGGTIGPIINGTTPTMSPVQALTTGHANHVTLVTDVWRDEFNGGVYTNSFGLNVVVAETPAQYRTLVIEQFGPLAPTVERLYPLSRFESSYTAYRTIMADSASVCPMLQLDRRASKFMPVYADIDADSDNPAGEDVTDVNAPSTAARTGWCISARRSSMQIKARCSCSCCGNGRISRRPEVRSLRRLSRGTDRPPPGIRS